MVLLFLPLLGLPPAIGMYALYVGMWCSGFKRPLPRHPWVQIFKLSVSADIAMFIGIGAYHTIGYHLLAILGIWAVTWAVFSLIGLMAALGDRARVVRSSPVRPKSSGASSAH